MNQKEKLTEATMLALQGKLMEDNNLNARDNNCEVIVNKNQFGYTTIGIIIDKENKEFQLVDGQRLPLGKYKKTTKKAIYDKANELEAMGYKKVRGTYSVSESASYNDFDGYGLPILEKPYYISYYENKDKAIIKSSHPYDLTEYSYAVAKLSDIMKAEDSITWVVYDYNKDWKPYKVGIVEGVEEAIELMKDLDSKKTPTIDKT